MIDLSSSTPKPHRTWIVAVVVVLLVAAVAFMGMYWVRQRDAADRDAQRVANVLGLYRSLQGSTSPLVFSGCSVGDPMIYCHVCTSSACQAGEDQTPGYLFASLFEPDNQKGLSACRPTTGSACLWSLESEGGAPISPTLFRLRFSLEHGTDALPAGSHVLTGYGQIE
jgi:hypothetical protein